MGMVACGDQGALACAEPDLGLPADGLDRGGELCQAQVPVATDCGRLPVGPRAFDESTTRRRMARLGHAAWLTPPPTGICRGCEPQGMHALSGVLDTRQVAQCGHRSDCHRALDTAQGLEGLDDRREAPGVHLLVAFAFSTASTCSLCRNGLHVFLKDHVLGRGGTDDLTAPAQVGRTPIGSPRRADSVPQHEGCAPPRGRLALPEGLFPCPAQVADGFIVDGGHIHRGEVPCAHEPGQVHGITPVGFDAVPRLCRHAGGGDDPADVALLPQGAIEPGTAGAGVVDDDELLPLRAPWPKQRVDSTRPCAESAAGDDLRAMCVGDRGDRNGRFMDSHANVERVRL